MSSAPAVQIEKLSFSWIPGQPVLSIGHFAVGRSERLFIQGASGSGKSTLLSIIGGVLQPDSGKVKVFDHDIERMSPAGRDAFRADHVGYIFQMFNLLPYLSILQNVILPCRFSDRRRRTAIAQGGSVPGEAGRLLARLGFGDPRWLKRPVGQLSIGQQQRVAAARALIGRPALVIADEPTSSLDADAREDFVDLLIEECDAAGATVIFVSHDRTLGHRFDRTVSLGDLNA